MLELILGSLLVIVTGLAVHAIRRLHAAEISLAQTGADLDGARFRLGDDVEVITNLRLDLVGVRADARREAREYVDRAMVYEKMLMEKNRQIANMAERVASLKLVPSVEGGEDMHVEEVIPDKPYSPELYAWINGLADGESRNQAHDFVEIRRAHLIDDEQILRELEEEWDA